MSEDTLENMLAGVLKESSPDFGESHAQLIENEYMDMAISASLQPSIDKKDKDNLAAMKETLSNLKKQLSACKNVKNVNRSKINAQISQKRAVLRKRISDLTVAIESADVV